MRIETLPNVWIERLKNRLTEPLPGRVAQVKMAPLPVDESRFQEQETNPARPGGVMALLYPKNGELYLPLMKRPSYDGVHSGQVSLPGGKLERQDRDLVATALRETEEEIGINPNHINVLGCLSDLFIIASNFKVKPTVGFIDEAPVFVPDPFEVEEVLEVSVAQLKNEQLRGIQEMRFGKYVIHSPYFDVQGHQVWGATAMILSELLDVLDSL